EDNKLLWILVGVARPNFQTSAAGIHIKYGPKDNKLLLVLVGVARPNFQTSAAGIHIKYGLVTYRH
ncbi:1423_t:CDS:2, partial [Ambispora gerdemannii]